MQKTDEEKMDMGGVTGGAEGFFLFDSQPPRRAATPIAENNVR